MREIRLKHVSSFLACSGIQSNAPASPCMKDLTGRVASKHYMVGRLGLIFILCDVRETITSHPQQCVSVLQVLPHAHGSMQPPQHDSTGKGRCLALFLEQVCVQPGACNCITLHYITLHHITSHHITSHYITLHHITSHYVTLHHITSHNIT